MKTLLVGVDGTSFTLIEKLVKNNRMPFTKMLIEKGSFGILKSVIPPDSPTAWSVAYTSRNPGQTSIYGFDKKDGNNYKFRVPTAADRFSKDVWQLASEKGKKVLICSMPLSFPPRKVNGVLVSDHFTPDKQNAVYPKERTKEIIEDFKYPLDSEKFIEVKDFLDSIDKRMEFIENELKTNEFDLVMLGLEQMEITCHKYWLDNEDLLYQIYEGYDKKLEEFYNKNFKDWNLLIHSDHGHKIYKKEFHVGSWLKENGFLELKSKQEIESVQNQKTFFEQNQIENRLGKGIQGKLGVFLYNVRQFIRHRLPFVKKLLPFVHTPQFISVQEVEISGKLTNYSKSCAFPYHEGHGNYGGIYINTIKQWKQGIVDVSEYAELRERLLDALASEEYVENVWHKEDLFKGPYMEEIPDIMFEIKPDIKVNGFDKDYRNNPVYKTHSTQHEMDGMVIAYGQAIKQGHKLSGIGDDLFDVAPTVLRSLELEIPVLFEGQVLDIFTQEFNSKSPVKRADIDLSVKKEDITVQISKEGQEKLEKQLKGLGYL